MFNTNSSPAPSSDAAALARMTELFNEMSGAPYSSPEPVRDQGRPEALYRAFNGWAQDRL